MGMEESEYITCKKCGKVFHEDSDHVCGRNPRTLYLYHNGIEFQMSLMEDDDGMIILGNDTIIDKNTFMDAIRKAY